MLLCLVPHSLVVALQPYMEWIPIKEKKISESCNLLSLGQFVMYCLMNLLHALLFEFTLLSFFISCFSFLFFFLILFVSVHKISILPSLLFQQFILFLLLIFPLVTFHLSDIYIITTIFLNSIFCLLKSSFNTILILFCDCSSF